MLDQTRAEGGLAGAGRAHDDGAISGTHCLCLAGGVCVCVAAVSETDAQAQRFGGLAGGMGQASVLDWRRRKSVVKSIASEVCLEAWMGSSEHVQMACLRATSQTTRRNGLRGDGREW
jgi:hypothetical protein